MKHHNIPLRQVDSSQIYAIGHDAAANVLAIQFKAKGDTPGSVYHYQNFTTEQFEAFANAESIGAHFGKFIKPEAEKHPFVKVDAEKTPQ